MGGERGWMLPEEVVPVRLMATIWADGEGRHDEFGRPADLDEWLDAVGVDRGGVAASSSEFRLARELRDSLRRLAAFVTGDERSAAASNVDLERAIATVNAAAAGLPAARLGLVGGKLELTAATTTVRAALAAVAVEAQRLLAEDNETLRACYAPGCVLYFVRTHHRREWCSVACGNRARAARHYRAIREARANK